MFPFDGAHTPESKKTRKCRPVRQVAAPAAESAVSHCILLVLVVIITCTEQKVVFFKLKKNREFLAFLKIREIHYKR